VKIDNTSSIQSGTGFNVISLLPQWNGTSIVYDYSQNVSFNFIAVGPQ
jgi:hypothetical protein